MKHLSETELRWYRRWRWLTNLCGLIATGIPGMGYFRALTDEELEIYQRVTR